MPKIILKEPGLHEIRDEDAIYIYCRSVGKKRNQKYHYKFYCKIGRYRAEHQLDFNIDKSIRKKIQNKEDLFSFEIVAIITKLEKELSRQSKDLVLLSKIQEAKDFFDSNERFIESIDTLVQLRLKSPDNIKYWEIALKQLNDSLQEKVKNLLNIKNKDITSGNLDELSEEDSAESPNAYRNFFIKSIRPFIVHPIFQL